MSVQAFNRIAKLEFQVRELTERLLALETRLPKIQACETGSLPKPSATLTMKKAAPSHA